MSREKKVFVVGGGPVGLTAALALRAKGLDVTVLEAEPEGRQRPGSRALFIHKEPLGYLDGLVKGLAQQIGEAGLTWHGARFTYEDRPIYEREFAQSTYRNYGTSLSQRDSEAFLYKAALDLGIVFRWSTSIRSVETDDTQITLTTEAGEKLVAPYIIAADGARSAVRQSLGIPLEGESSDIPFIIADVSAEILDDWPAQLTFHYKHGSMDGRNLLILPFKGGWRFDLQCLAEDDADFLGSPEGCRTWLGAYDPRLKEASIDWVSTYKFRQLVAKSFTDPHRRVLLVGEAAHLFAPFGGRGLNSGIIDACDAATAIDTALNTDSRSEAIAAVDEFNRTRRAAAIFNKDIAASGLDRLAPGSLWAHLKRWLAAKLAPWVSGAGRWLSQGPTGVSHGRSGGSSIY